MDKIVILKNDEEKIKEHKNEHHDYEYFKKVVVPRSEDKQTSVAIYEIPPKKSAYPYHYHLKNEETYYIISGEGILRTVDGNIKVGKGDIMYFPANSNGAHKLTNTSDKEMLIYIDFDTNNDLEVSFYPDSNKIGIWGKQTNQLHKLVNKVDYYDGE